MKKILITILLAFAAITVGAQEEKGQEPMSAKATFEVKMNRPCSTFDVEGTKYENVHVSVYVGKNQYPFEDGADITIIVKDRKNKKIFEDKIKNGFFFLFKDGQVQVASKGITQMVIWPLPDSRLYTGILRKDGNMK